MSIKAACIPFTTLLTRPRKMLPTKWADMARSTINSCNIPLFTSPIRTSSGVLLMMICCGIGLPSFRQFQHKATLAVNYLSRRLTLFFISQPCANNVSSMGHLFPISSTRYRSIRSISAFSTGNCKPYCSFSVLSRSTAFMLPLWVMRQ